MDSFTKFPNFILEKLIAFDLSGRELRVILCVIRKTYGYHKAAEELSLKVLSDLTGIDKSDVGKIIKNLIEREILIEVDKPEFYFGRTVALNEDIDNWKLKKPTTTVCENTTPTVGKNSTPTYIKENNKRNIKEISYRRGVYEKKVPSYTGKG